VLGFPAVWLRHNCPCADCRDPVTGQRLIEMADIPPGTRVTVTGETAESVELVFTPEGHRAAFSRAWLDGHRLPAPAPAPERPARSPWLNNLAGVRRPEPGSSGALAAAEPVPVADPRTEDGKRLWRAADLAELPGATWDDYLADDAVRAACLDAVATLGFTRLRGVPAEPGAVLRVAETFGFVRETNYGRLFDVRVQADPDNLAFTSRAIAPHTDNPYRDPVPTLQLLHCLRDADLGGDTGLVDGFAAAAALRAADPGSFTVLAGTAWPFAYADSETELRSAQPLISLTPAGRITAVRLNNRSLQPLRLPAAEAEAAYAAYRAWTALLGGPRFQLTLRLVPGDCLIFDNTRVLHARTAFTAPPAPAGGPRPADSGPAHDDLAGGEPAAGDPGDGALDGGIPAEDAGERHLQGCYADIDGLLSTLAVLRRPAPTPSDNSNKPAAGD
jgi:gamma-butyrobetaine dioxygenase